MLPRRGPIVAVLALLVTIAAQSGPVSAHADLVRSEPAANADLREAPTQLSLFFSQGLKRDGSWVQVEDADGTRLPVQVVFDDSDPRAMRATVSGMKPGTYDVNWQTLSADDDDYHNGSYQLTVLNPDGSSPAAAQTSTGSDSGGSDIAVLVAVSVVVVLGIGGLGYYIRKTGRASR